MKVLLLGSLSSIVAYLIVFYTLVIRATLKIRHLPTYDNPDPKTLGFETHIEAIDLFFTLALISSALGVITLLLSYISGLNINRAIKSTFVAVLICWVFHLFYDPFFVWFAD